MEFFWGLFILQYEYFPIWGGLSTNFITAFKVLLLEGHNFEGVAGSKPLATSLRQI